MNHQLGWTRLAAIPWNRELGLSNNSQLLLAARLLSPKMVYSPKLFETWRFFSLLLSVTYLGDCNHDSASHLSLALKNVYYITTSSVKMPDKNLRQVRYSLIVSEDKRRHSPVLPHLPRSSRHWLATMKEAPRDLRHAMRRPSCQGLLQVRPP